MRVLFLARSTLYSVYGGDTVQITSTAKYLRRLGVSVDIKLSNERIDYKAYNLLHIFNIIRPADALKHIRQSKLPYVVSTIFLDYSESQQKGAGIRPFMSKHFSPDTIEYAKTIARWIKNGETIKSVRYLYYGHRKSVISIAENAAMILPNSENEYIRFVNRYQTPVPHKVVYNGIDIDAFAAQKQEREQAVHNPTEVICVARIENNKNQLNLIRALNNTPFHLKIVGKPAPNHIKYYKLCQAVASDNITFTGFITPDELIENYMTAKVHVLPSWNETCGLSSLEAAYLNCNIVITEKGDTREYYKDNAWYCNPDDPQSIYDAVVKAAKAPISDRIRNEVITTYNWQEAASETLAAYEAVLNIGTCSKQDGEQHYKTFEDSLLNSKL